MCSISTRSLFCFHRKRHAVGGHVRRVPGSPVEKVPVGRHRRMGDQAFVAWRGILLVQVSRHARRIDLHRRVVNDPEIARTKLPGLDVALCGNRDRQDEMTIHVVAAGAQRVGRHRQDEVGRAKPPRPARQRRRRGRRWTSCPRSCRRSPIAPGARSARRRAGARRRILRRRAPASTAACSDSWWRPPSAPRAA